MAAITGVTNTVLIDGDVFAYKFACTNQELHECDGMFNLVSNGPQAVQDLDDYLVHLSNKLQANNIVIALSDTTNFRKDVLKTYKANRSAVLKPLCLQFVRDHITSTYTTYQRPGLEGDDILGILATHPTLIPGKKMVVSIDKDFLTVPCHFYNPDKDEHLHITEDEANYNFMLQTIIGDQTDNYKGVPGVGPKKAKLALSASDGSLPDLWKMVVCTYERVGLTKEDALQQARCARILRASDYDFKKKQVILWNP